MATAAWICSGILLFVVGFLVYAAVAQKRRDQYYREHAKECVGWIVQANTDLFSKGGGDRPAQILVALDGATDEPDRDMFELALRVTSFKGKSGGSPDEGRVAALVNDESYRPSRRFRLPASFTGGRRVYSMHIWIKRSLLPGGVLNRPYVRCLVLRDDPRSPPLMVEYRPADGGDDDEED